MNVRDYWNQWSAWIRKICFGKMNKAVKQKITLSTKVAITVDSLCEPIFISSAQLLTIVQLLTKLVSFAAL